MIAPTPSTGEERRRILVVDDEEGIRMALERAIVRGGYESFTACDGIDGLAQAEKVKPSVIIVDLRMPRMDGHTFLRRLSALDLDSVVLVSSADGDMDDVIEAMRSGAIDYVKKPWSPSNVLAAISRALDVHAKRRSTRAIATAEGPAKGFSHIVEQIKRGEILLPSLPKIIRELRDLVTDRGSTLDRVAKLVECDQALLARVLRLGSSALYASGKQGDLKHTIGRLGLETLHAVVETIWVNGCFQSRDPRFVPYSDRLAKFGVARAIAARRFAPSAKIPAQTAYYSGLFADVGASFLLHVIVEKTPDATPDPEPVIEFVRIHHEAIGAMLLAQWGQSDAVIQCSRAHHASTVMDTRDSAAMVLKLATAAAAELTGQDDLTGGMPDAATVTECARAFGIAPASHEEIVDASGFELAALLEVL